jgi:hypothetical protein
VAAGLMLWRIFYTDGSTYSNTDGSPYDAPPDGVQVIVKSDKDNGRFLVAQRDYYWFDHRRQQWFGGDIGGFWQHLRKPGPAKVLFGEFVTNEEYQACVSAALADPDFQPKSARHPEEAFAAGHESRHLGFRR